MKSFLIALPIFVFALFPARAAAMCPVCAIAVGSAVVLLEKYGVDNTITGVWIGALLVSSSVMLINWLRTKKISMRVTEILIFIFFYASLIIPFHHKMIIGNPSKMIWGMDKTLLGIALGGTFFYLFVLLYQRIKQNNAGRAHFPFQKVVIPLVPLVILSLVFYFLTSG